jgi:hypothetical protein
MYLNSVSSMVSLRSVWWICADKALEVSVATIAMLVVSRRIAAIPQATTQAHTPKARDSNESALPMVISNINPPRGGCLGSLPLDAYSSVRHDCDLAIWTPLRQVLLTRLKLR